MEIQLTDREQKVLDKIQDPKQYNKFQIKTLVSLSLRLWGIEETNLIFDPSDTCYCSASKRRSYKELFLKKWNENAQ